MTIANCLRCARMFHKTPGVKICPDCQAAEEAAFRLVADFLEANPGADIASVSAGTGVEQAMILRLVQAGRLASLGDLAAGLSIECRQCAKPVISGQYCPECTEAMGQALRNSAKMLLSGPEAPSTRIRRPETLREKRGTDSSSFPDRR